MARRGRKSKSAVQISLKLIDEDLGWDAMIARIEQLSEFHVRAGNIGNNKVLLYARKVEKRWGYIRNSSDQNQDRMADRGEFGIGRMIDGAGTAIEALEPMAEEARNIIKEGIIRLGLIDTGDMLKNTLGQVWGVDGPVSGDDVAG